MTNFVFVLLSFSTKDLFGVEIDGQSKKPFVFGQIITSGGENDYLYLNRHIMTPNDKRDAGILKVAGTVFPLLVGTITSLIIALLIIALAFAV